jgi:hypothetical protein
VDTSCALDASVVTDGGLVVGKKTFMTGTAAAESANSAGFFFLSTLDARRFYAASRVFFLFRTRLARTPWGPSLAFRSLFSRARDDGP